MTDTRRITFALAVTVGVTVAALAIAGSNAHAQQGKGQAVNTLPNPYMTISNLFTLPEGRKWGSTSAVDVDKDGKTIWVAERCGANSCLNSPTVDPVLHFDEKGKLIKSFGAGLLVFAHGIHVDRDGNIWVTDGNGNAPTGARGGGARGAAPAAPAPFVPPLGATKGHQVIKFSPDGRVLMTIGKPGGAAPPECCYQPNDVITSANGDIFVSEGHNNGTGLIFKFDKTGKLIKTIGKAGSGPGEFSIPHSLAFDSKGRLFVADRGNVRIQILDQDGKFLEEWYQFSRLSGIYIDKHDMVYGADSESTPTSNPTAEGSPAWIKGIRIGSAKDGKVQYFIPDPEAHLNPSGTSAAEGVAVDAQGNIYGAEVGPQKAVKYVRK